MSNNKMCKCIDCGRVLGADEIVSGTTGVEYAGTWELADVCPSCGSTNLADVAECPICGKLTEDESGVEYCDECFDKMLSVRNATEYASTLPAEPVRINALYAHLYSASDIERLIRHDIEMRAIMRGDVVIRDARAFIYDNGEKNEFCKFVENQKNKHKGVQQQWQSW